MRTIVHLSDLHFGRVDEDLLAPLTEFLRNAHPDLVVVSGDLTQRARSAEFIAARAFLDGLPVPQIVVPGNHDIPLHNIMARFSTPLAKYQRYITENLEPSYVDSEIAVLGINTARSLTIKNGRVNRNQIERIRANLCNLDGRLTKILVTHHPFVLPSHLGDTHLVGRPPLAMRQLASCGVSLLLAGHMHSSHAVITSDHYQTSGLVAMAVQAGTATSTRGRGESNSFNILRIVHARIEIERVSWTPERGAFITTEVLVFYLTPTGWINSRP